MKRKILGFTAMAIFALVHDSWAAGNTNSAATPAGGIRATISCRDLQLVPMTADAEQALPLQVVAHLACGDQVAVLSDSDGYTVKIRTFDGKNGYVARMYLAASTAAPSSLKPTNEAATDNGIARWVSGTRGSEQLYIDGSLIESLTAGGITVQVSLHDTDWKLRASVAIANQSGAPVHVNPRLFTLDELTPRLRSLAYQDPRRLAKAPTHQVLWTAASATAPAGSVRQSQTSAYLVSTYQMPTHEATTAPNYFAQAQAGQETKSPAFTECTIDPKQKVSGAVWFERDKNPQELTLRVFVGDLIFEFPLSFSQHN